MHLWGKSRLFNLLGMIVFLGLAVCVFTWGLQYKLSLYDPPQASSHQIPQAKLLSKNEQTGTTESQLVVRTKTSTRVSYTVPTSVFFVLLLALGMLNPQVSSRREHAHGSCLASSSRHIDIFFVRPRPSSPSSSLRIRLTHIRLGPIGRLSCVISSLAKSQLHV